MFLKSIRQFRRADHIMVVTAPPSLPFTTALAAMLRGASYTLLLHDCYPEILVAVGKTKQNSLLVQIANFFNRVLHKHASKIIVVGRDMKELMERKTKGLDIPIDVVPNWADLELIHPTERDKSPLLAQLGIRDKFVLMYAGNIGHPTDIETIIDAAEAMLDRPQYHFVFIGSGAKRKWLNEQVRDRRLSNVTLLGVRPRDEQIEFLNACDIGLVALVRGMWGTAMPSRTYNIMAAGKPIIALTEPGSELARVIDEDGIGIHVLPGDRDSLIDAITKMCSDRGELNIMGNRAYAAAREKYSLDTAIEKYTAALS